MLTNSFSITIDGSSPRMRGTLPAARRVEVVVGIIPAHAGNTASTLHVSLFYWDHPRACGEHRLIPWTAACREGSSPRMRGTPTVSDRDLGRLRIIPAHAWNTAAHTPRLPGSWDHPRACGEHGGHTCTPSRRAGSSPRMRGTLHGAADVGRLAGIIPAHAGNTPCWRR